MSRRLIRKSLILLCAISIAVYLGLSVAGGVLLMENALHAPRFPLTEHAIVKVSMGKFGTSRAEDVSVAGADGALLKGWYEQPRNWNGDAVILLHGVGDNREGVTGYAPIFLNAGYAVLLPDSRAQGQSGGQFVTYGLLESQDLRHWAEWLNGRQRSSLVKAAAGCIDLFGESMGAAIALQATATTPGVCAVVAEAPFASFREIGYERIAQGTGLNVSTVRVIARPMVEIAFLEARLSHGLDFDKASPEQALAGSHVPSLLIAGLADQNIPPRHAREIVTVARSPVKLWEVPGAGHTAAMSVDPVEFQRRVVRWFAAHSHTIVHAA